MKRKMKALLLALLYYPFFFISAVEACSEAEKKALLDLRVKAGAQWPSSAYSDWATSPDCCRWQGITCSNNRHVVALHISTSYSPDTPGSTSCGALPPSIALLQPLEVLDVANSCFSGPLISLSSFLNLTSLNLSSTAFSFLHVDFAAPKLAHIDFSHNNVAFQFPVSGLDLLPSLQYFRFSSNHGYYTGPFLPNITSLTHLLHLDLSSNGIQDSLPPQFGRKLSKLQYLDLHDNALQGQIPAELKHLQSLVYLDLSSNHFVGAVPITSLAELPLLMHLDLNAAGNVWLDAVSAEPHCNWSGPHLEYLGLSSVRLPSLITPLCFDSSAIFSSRLKFLDLSYTGLNSSWEVLYRPILSKAVNLVLLSLAGVPGNFLLWVSQFKNLESLDISRCSLTGGIPRQLGQLNKLRSLDASSNALSGSIPTDLIANLSSLESLKLPQNSLTGQIPMTIANLTQLQWLDLSNNHFIGSIPSNLGLSQNHLDIVQLQFNSLTGGLPSAIGNIAKLDVSNNQVSGPLASIIGNWSRIRYCELYGNNIMGSIPYSIGNWTQLWHLSMGHNRFTGCIPHSISQLTHLSIVPEEDMTGGPVGDFYDYAVAYGLYLSNNFLTCSIPRTLASLSNLIYLDVSNNNLTGSLPQLVNLTALLSLKLARNSLSGIVPSPLTIYNELDLTSNAFEGPSPTVLVPSRQIGAHHVGLADEAGITIRLSNNKFTSFIHVESLCYNLTEKTISLSFSSNRLTGNIPVCLSNLSTLTSLDISHNMLSGNLPPFSSSLLSLLDVSNNHLLGSLPSFSGTTLSSLVVLDMSNNFLSGSLASASALNGSQFLQILKAGNNSFVKEGIPDWISSFHALVTLSLHNNRFKGQIPSSLSKCVNLVLLDLSRNMLTGRIPAWIPNKTFPALQVLSLRSNRLQGRISDALVTWSSLQILDLANNELEGPIPTNVELNAMKQVNVTTAPGALESNTEYSDIIISFKHVEIQTKVLPSYRVLDLSGNHLSGSIPQAIGSLKALLSLNLSHNRLSGEIPTSLEGLSKVESLDLSHNLLTGTIPNDLLSLASLDVLDLSFNHLQGHIPHGSHPFNASAFVGNPGLCGMPLPKPCPNLWI